jgi:hypothetical protein
MENIKVIKSEIVNESEERHETHEAHENDNINHLTLRYMMNRDLYENYIISNHDDRVANLKEEQKFYRSRIFQLAKVLLLTDKEREKYFSMNPSFDISQISFDVFTIFDEFIKIAIQNFKVIDTNEIFQKESTLEEDRETTVSEFKEHIPSKQKTLDKFLIKTAEPVIYPEQKVVDINDVKFKKKGLRKKIGLI